MRTSPCLMWMAMVLGPATRRLTGEIMPLSFEGHRETLRGSVFTTSLKSWLPEGSSPGAAGHGQLAKGRPG